MFIWLQKCIPQHGISRWLGKLANARLGMLTHFLIKRFILHYQVDLSESQITDYRKFQTFNAFFTRALKPNARVMNQNPNGLISPVDGCVSELGYANQDQLLQAKGVHYGLQALCAGDAALAQTFEQGAFLTAYLAPRDYHRIHMPIAGKLIDMIYVPGSLFSVNPVSVNGIENLFARNERVICVFETAIGKVAVIAVGAMIVGSVVTKWHGVVSPSKSRMITHWNYEDQKIELQQGDELGHFQLGSTVIMLCEKNRVKWASHLQANSPLKLGEVISCSM